MGIVGSNTNDPLEIHVKGTHNYSLAYIIRRRYFDEAVTKCIFLGKEPMAMVVIIYGGSLTSEVHRLGFTGSEYIQDITSTEVPNVLGNGVEAIIFG
jgi:hypothetical protein